jgi:hypothetical protein
MCIRLRLCLNPIITEQPPLCTTAAGTYISTVFGLAQQLIGTMSIICSGKQMLTVGPVGLLLNTTFYQNYQLACSG